MPLPIEQLYKGNAYTDGALRGGWFVASFIDTAFGLRCRSGKTVIVGADKADFEMKMLRHYSGDTEKRLFPSNKTATSFAMLVGEGRFEVFFCFKRDNWEHVTLNQEGDYALWAPEVGHHWSAPEAATIFTVRIPGIPGDQQETPLDEVPDELKRFFDNNELERRERERIKAGGAEELR